MSIVDDSYNNLISAYEKLLIGIKKGIKKYEKDALDKIEALPTDPNNLTQKQIDDMKELAELAITEAEKGKKLTVQEKKDLNKDFKVGIEIFDDLRIKQKTKPKGSSQSTLIRNQEIVDKCYELEKKGIKARTIYNTVANEYNLSWETIKKIISAHDATPTSLKKS